MFFHIFIASCDTFRNYTKKDLFFLICIQSNEKKRQISCNFNIYKSGQMRYNIYRKKGQSNLGRLLTMHNSLPFETEYQSYDITSFSKYLLCFFI